MTQTTNRRPQLERFQRNGTHMIGWLKIPTFHFECGITLSDVRLRFETWGTLNAAKSNVVVVCHALTGDAHAGDGGDEHGWWSGLIGPGRAIDTQQSFVICANVIGGCAGSTGPASLAVDGRPYGLRFPRVTVRDMVTAEVLLLDAFEVERVAMVVGGSLGGMQAWEWALLVPYRVQHAIVIAAQAAFPPLAIGYNEAMRQAIVADPRWSEGNYYDTGEPPTAGLAAARAIGMLTYRTHQMYRDRFGRRQVLKRAQQPGENAGTAWTAPHYEVESYLRHHGEKLNARFDANSYLYLTRAMDDHDIGRNRGGISAALARIQSRFTIVGIPGDYLYEAEELRATAAVARQWGIDCQYEALESMHGHDAFLIEQEQLGEILVRVRGGTAG